MIDGNFTSRMAGSMLRYIVLLALAMFGLLEGIEYLWRHVTIAIGWR